MTVTSDEVPPKGDAITAPIETLLAEIDAFRAEIVRLAGERDAASVVSRASAWDRAFWDANPEWDDDGRDARWLDSLRAIGPHSETTIHSRDTIRFYPCKVAILEARP